MVRRTKKTLEPQTLVEAHNHIAPYYVQVYVAIKYTTSDYRMG